MEDQEIGEVTGKVCAIVDAFPGYDRYEYVENKDGEIVCQEKYLIVANYATVTTDFGLTPYTVWMRVEDDVEEAQLTEFLNERGVEITQWTSADELAAKSRNASMIQITNGMFTMSFLISILICSVGF